MSERPGVMVYFDDIRPLQKWLSVEDAGALFFAILDYAQYGEVKELPGNASIAFDVLKPHIDKDARTYADKCLKKKHAAYVRWARDKGQPELDFEEWREKYGVLSDSARLDTDACAYENDAHARTELQMQEKPMQPMPTTTSTTTSTSISTSTSTSKEIGVQGEEENERELAFLRQLLYKPPSEEAFEEMREARIRELSGYVF